MTKSLFVVMSALLLWGIGACSFLQEEKAPAQKIADFVMKNGGEDVRVYTGHDVYLISVSEAGLSIDYYATNRDFSKKRGANDNIADTLIWGTPGIIVETHILDEGIDQSVDIFQRFTALEGGVYHEFTREERDRGATIRGEKKGLEYIIKEELVDHGKTFSKTGFKQTDPETLAEIQTEYLRQMKAILENL